MFIRKPIEIVSEKLEDTSESYNQHVSDNTGV